MHLLASVFVPFIIWAASNESWCLVMFIVHISAERAGRKKETKQPTATKEETQKSFILFRCRFVCYELLFSRRFEIIIWNNFDLSQHNNLTEHWHFYGRIHFDFGFMCLSVWCTLSRFALETNFKSKLRFLYDLTDCIWERSNKRTRSGRLSLRLDWAGLFAVVVIKP